MNDLIDLLKWFAPAIIVGFIFNLPLIILAIMTLIDG